MNKTNLLTIKEYAELKGISTQAVYKKIKAKQLKTTIKDGKTFIKCKDTLNEQHEQDQDKTINDESLTKLIEVLKNQLAEKDKQINSLMLLNGNLQSIINERETKLLEYTNRTFSQRFKDLFKGTSK